ncbi:unnamed protein product [Urochloa humidicola]
MECRSDDSEYTLSWGWQKRSLQYIALVQVRPEQVIALTIQQRRWQLMAERSRARRYAALESGMVAQL